MRSRHSSMMRSALTLSRHKHTICQIKPQRPLGGFSDADSWGGEDFSDAVAVVFNPQRRCGVGVVEAVCILASDAVGLAQSAGAGGDEGDGGGCREAAQLTHLRYAARQARVRIERLDSAKQHSSAGA